MTPTNEPTIWQVSAGTGGREYSGDFYKYGLAFVGGPRQVAAMERVRTGDIMALKDGLTKIVAVGRVVERDGRFGGGVGDHEKEWLRDYDGWDLPCYRYVDWRVLNEAQKTSGLTMSAITRVDNANLRGEIMGLFAQSASSTTISPEPESPKPVTDDEMLTYLIHEGLRPAAAEDLTTALRRIRLLARYYYDQDNWADVREHETRAFLILPLLLALGWTEQQIKIELPSGDGGLIDIACFSKPYRRDATGVANNGDCALILETKSFTNGLGLATEQALRYVRSFPNCQKVVTSNGYCYKTFERGSNQSFDTDPSAYLNFLRPRDRYPLDPKNVGGALEVLRHLLP